MGRSSVVIMGELKDGEEGKDSRGGWGGRGRRTWEGYSEFIGGG